jgi:hypothetical protein
MEQRSWQSFNNFVISLPSRNPDCSLSSSQKPAHGTALNHINPDHILIFLLRFNITFPSVITFQKRSCANLRIKILQAFQRALRFKIGPTASCWFSNSKQPICFMIKVENSMGYIKVAYNDFTLTDYNTLRSPLIRVYTTTVTRLTADHGQDEVERAMCNCLTANFSSCYFFTFI